MLFQTADDARRLFSFIDPALGVPLPERSYAEDCRIFTPENPESQYKNVMGTVYDEFLIAHLLGWFGKSLILRDAYLSWFISILFEVLELSLEHILPNFKECWWDHIVLDVLICNGIGIYLGHLVLKYLELKEYDWGGRTNAGKKRQRSVSNAKRMVLQFTPYSWTKFNWSILESPKRFFAVIGFIALESIIELNCFFLKFVLWHPPPHPLVTARLFLWFLFALPATREYYEWISNPKCKRIGTMAWLALAITGTEILIWLKFSKGQFDHVVSHPPAVVWSWAIFLIGLFSWALFYFYFYKPRKQRQQQEQKKQE
jgi:phosphatidylserine synthase 2